MNFIIAGGTGLIGRALRSKLEAAGHSVRIITRQPKAKTELSWDVIRSSGLPTDTNSIINLCGRSIGEVNPLFLLPGPYKAYMDEVFSSRIETNKLLVRASTSLPLKTYISASAIGFYRPDLEAKFTEDEPFVDRGILIRFVKEWEEAAQIPNKPNVRQYQLRLGHVLARDSNFVRALYPSHRVGFGGPMGSGKQWISWIHLDDIVGAIEFLLKKGSSVRGGPVNLVSPNACRQAAFAKAFGESLNAPKLPFAPFKTPEFAANFLLGNERASIILEGQRVLPKILEDAGYVFRYPKLEDALHEIFGRLPNPVPVD